MLGNWINLNDSKPPVNVLVDLAHYPTGIGGTRWDWTSEGRLRESGIFAIKQNSVGSVTFHQKPTHWKFKQE